MKSRWAYQFQPVRWRRRTRVSASAVAALEDDLGDGGGADVHAGGEVAGDGADEEAGEVGHGLPAALGVPAVPAGDVEGVLEDGEVGLAGLGGVASSASASSAVDRKPSPRLSPGVAAASLRGEGRPAPRRPRGRRGSGGGSGRRAGRRGCPTGTIRRGNRGSRSERA